MKKTLKFNSNLASEDLKKGFIFLTILSFFMAKFVCRILELSGLWILLFFLFFKLVEFLLLNSFLYKGFKNMEIRLFSTKFFQVFLLTFLSLETVSFCPTKGCRSFIDLLLSYLTLLLWIWLLYNGFFCVYRFSVDSVPELLCCLAFCSTSLYVDLRLKLVNESILDLQGPVIFWDDMLHKLGLFLGGAIEDRLFLNSAFYILAIPRLSSSTLSSQKRFVGTEFFRQAFSFARQNAFRVLGGVTVVSALDTYRSGYVQHRLEFVDGVQARERLANQVEFLKGQKQKYLRDLSDISASNASLGDTVVEKVFFLFISKVNKVSNPRLQEATKEALDYVERQITVYEAKIFYIDCALTSNQNTRFTYFLERPLTDNVLKAESILDIDALLCATPEERYRIVQLVGRAIILEGKKPESIVKDLGPYAAKQLTSENFRVLSAYEPSFDFLSWIFGG